MFFFYMSKMFSVGCARTRSGPDGIPTSFLKKYISCLLVSIQRLFCSSLSSGIFWSFSKHAHMFAVHQNDSKRDVNNYRGIKSLSALSKLPWRNPFQLPSYDSRCSLIDLELLRNKRDTARAMTIAGTLHGRIDCEAILARININVQQRTTQCFRCLWRTNWDLQGGVSGLQRTFNGVASMFDFKVDFRDMLILERRDVVCPARAEW